MNTHRNHQMNQPQFHRPTKSFIALLLLITFCSGSVIAQENNSPDAEDLRWAMWTAIASIEEAAGLDPEASQAISEIDEEYVETIFSSMANKEEFIASTQQVVERIESAKAAMAKAQAAAQEPLMLPMLSSTSTTPFPPNYPNVGIDFSVAYALGLVDSVDDRCSGEALEEYEAVLAGAEAALAIGDAACQVAGCDPTGIVCASVCGAVEAVKLAVLAAKVPLDACAAHGNAVDSAEIEAGYENTVKTLNNLAEIDTEHTQIINKINNISGQVANVQTDADSLGIEINALSGKMDVMDDKINGLHQKTDVIDEKIEVLTAKVDAMNEQMNARFDALETKMDQRLDYIVELLCTPQGLRPDFPKK